MKHTPFAALPASERLALVEAFSGSGIALQDVCVSKLELFSVNADDSLCCLATVSGRGWGATYDARRSWIAQLKQDLEGLAARTAAPAGHC
jgi:hypothetical protein